MRHGRDYRLEVRANESKISLLHCDFLRFLRDWQPVETNRLTPKRAEVFAEGRRVSYNVEFQNKRKET